ncbi:MAG: DUF1707 SHOCT-like domain-containing protein [Nocardioidaceae bacterium]
MNIESELRIGDAERDAAIASLAKHYAAGRLTHAEFDERSDLVLKARTGSQLHNLFTDLPQERPDPPRQARQSGPRGAGRSSRRGSWRPWAAIPLLPIICIVVGVTILAHVVMWPLLIIAGVWFFGGHHHSRAHWRRW